MHIKVTFNYISEIYLESLITCIIHKRFARLSLALC